MTILSFSYRESNYFNVNEETSEIFANSLNYEDKIDDKNYVSIASISSQVVNKNYVKLFIDYKEEIDDIVFEFNNELKPKKDRRGMSSNIAFGKSKYLNKFERDSIAQLYLKTFNHIYKTKIDENVYAHDFILTHNHKGQLGFLTYIKIDSISEGKHILKIERLIKPKNDSVENIISIPFWYYKN